MGRGKAQKTTDLIAAAGWQRARAVPGLPDLWVMRRGAASGS